VFIVFKIRIKNIYSRKEFIFCIDKDLWRYKARRSNNIFKRENGFKLCWFWA